MKTRRRLGGVRSSFVSLKEGKKIIHALNLNHNHSWKLHFCSPSFTIPCDMYDTVFTVQYGTVRSLFLPPACLLHLLDPFRLFLLVGCNLCFQIYRIPILPARRIFIVVVKVSRVIVRVIAGLPLCRL
jgi:hypothetical protein